MQDPEDRQPETVPEPEREHRETRRPRIRRGVDRSPEQETEEASWAEEADEPLGGSHEKAA